MNGKPGDQPFTDIVVHGRQVYSEHAADLVREIAGLVDDKARRQLADWLFREYNVFESPNVVELERELTRMRDEARRAAKERGFEV